MSHVEGDGQALRQDGSWIVQELPNLLIHNMFHMDFLFYRKWSERESQLCENYSACKNKTVKVSDRHI